MYSGAIDVVAYTDQSLYTSETAATATTTSASSAQTTGKSTPTTKTSGSATNGGPAATKTSAGELTIQFDMMTGLFVPLFAVVWTLLGAQL